MAQALLLAEPTLVSALAPFMNPYQGELAVLAKTFPNVYVDFCWAYPISGSVARRALHEMMETAPINKILGFGGDYFCAEMSYAHSRMARQSIAQVLSEKAESGFCTEDDALEIARMLLPRQARKLVSSSHGLGGLRSRPAAVRPYELSFV